MNVKGMQLPKMSSIEAPSVTRNWRIAAVEQPTVTRHDRTRILKSRVALDARFDQIADNAEHATDRAEHERLDDVHLDPRNEREQAPECHGKDEAGEEAFPFSSVRPAGVILCLPNFEPIR